ncbi:ATP-grasp domain-containing protein [Massilia antarctica]|uniref:ATP-grasp domain-containing protein n=1 Tax=Massilia antarctica TaxID=2765360 RepID=A0AA48W9I6_9BURK|nr:ATP-grasp domain-containing protein [Massilia antarctica]QPI47459.1 ATP-grasp domain-containing protein [Massilia antarctica]
MVSIARLENKLVVVSDPVGVAAYDFDVGSHFDCTHPYRFDAEEPCVLRTGPIADYDAEFADKLAMGLRLVNSPQEHVRASELEAWYPLLDGLTPRTEVFDSLPPADRIEAAFNWPVFMKGSRQTSKHNPDLSVIRSRAHYEQAARLYREDPILHWQKPVIREFIPLQPVRGQVAGKVRPLVEYRSFWWHGHCVGWGRYWHQVAPYACADEAAGQALAARAAALVRVPFLVVDVARTADGRWIVIECNDAQESGYAGIAPLLLWRQVLARIGTEGA